MDKLVDGIYEGERALYGSNDLEIVNGVFQNGESPLKESRNIRLSNCTFRWKYPLWYCTDVVVTNCKWEITGRSGVWYTRNLLIRDSSIDAPKQFRRCDGVTLINCSIPNAQETFWACKNIKLQNITAKGDYFGFNCENVEVENFDLDGNYAFDGGKNIVIRNAKLASKDSFWNCENVTVYDSVIVGEYLGWNSKNLTFINCTIESNQGMCYIDGLKMVNCKLINTDLAFERCSNIDAEIKSSVVSIKNPYSGRISVEDVEDIILDEKVCDPNKTLIEIRN